VGRVRICVERVEGECAAGYKPGDCFTLDGFKYESRVPLCVHALLGITPIAYAMARGASARDLGVGDEDSVGYLQCPDPGPPVTRGGRVIFRLERVGD